MSVELRLPSEQKLIANLQALAKQEEAIALAVNALQTGHFKHPDGRVDHLSNVRVSLGQAGLLAYLAQECPTYLSVEVGFGIAIVPHPAVIAAAAAEQLAVIKLAEKEWERPVGAIYRSDRSLSLAAKKFVQLLEAPAVSKAAA